ncbi:MAG: putative LPS assembly protein LptD [Gemmatimonadaceae bacterium]
MRGWRGPRVAVAAVVSALAFAGWANEARAQGTVPPPPPPTTTPGQPGAPRTPASPQANPMRTADDSAQARRDSLRNAPLVRWPVADSVGDQLMRLNGFRTVRYKADEVVFGAADKSITLTQHGAERAAVLRDPTTIVARTITYSDTSATVRACGDSIVLRDASRPGEDVNAGGPDCMAYDMERKEGRASLLSTSTKSTATWYVSADVGAFSGDSASAQGNAFYGRNGIITSCPDSFPHYHFRATEIKRIGGTVMVARPAILYIQDIPVMWFPFIFQDSHAGRHSGILTPQFGLTELLRNSPDYRRTVYNAGYYFALSDYYDAQVSMDWRSAAKATFDDPGWVWYHSTVRYKLLDRFLSGTISASEQELSSGSSNFTLSWQHAQNFSLASRLTMNLNYTSNTTVQRQTAINPIAPLATILSQIGYSDTKGPFSLQIGGERRQYPGRPEIDDNLPSLSLTSQPINVSSWLLWTPSFTFASSQSQHIDSQGDFSYRYNTLSDGTLDSTSINRSTKNTTIAFNTPFKVGDFQVTAAVRTGDTEADYPQLRTILDPLDTAARTTRVYQRTYLETIDFDLSVATPQLIQSRWNITPNVSISNVDPGAYFVRSERTGATWVSQSKRLSYGLSISPTFYGLFGGFGPVAKWRHSITPSLSFSYSPQATVSNAYLEATGRSPIGYLGALAQKQMTLSLSTNIEAKLKQGGDSDITHPENARKIHVLSLVFTPLTWDFQRAQETHKTGFTTDNFGYTLRSDLLPGFDFGSDYSLFQGNVLSDSAKFSPYLTDIHATFTLDGKSPLVHAFQRLFGTAPPRVAASAHDTTGTLDRPDMSQTDQTVAQMQTVAGPNSPQQALAQIPVANGFTASVTFTDNQQRPPVGGNVIAYDPTLQCQSLQAINPVQYDLCVRSALATPPVDATNSTTTAGGSIIQYPPQMNIAFQTSFPLTEKWSANWQTNYDLELRQFGSQTISLSRQLHDWRAVFGFTQAPNGNFSFTFFIALNAEQDVKFNYNRSDYRQP